MSVTTYFNQQRMKKDGTIPIYICVSRPPHRFYVNSGLSASHIFEGEVFPRSESNHRAKTMRLNKMLDQIEGLMLSDKPLPIQELKERIKVEVLGEAEDRCERKLYDYILEFSKTKIAERTREIYYQTYRAVYKYDSKADINIDFHWLERFEAELLQTNKVNTVSMHMRNLKATLNWAIKNDWLERNPFRNFTIKYERTPKRNLSIGQIRDIMKADYPPHVAKARDFFILTFLLIGINGVDLLSAKTTRDNRLEYIRSKTHKDYSIKVEPEAWEIINRYKGTSYLVNFGDCKDYKNTMMRINLNLKKVLPHLTTYYARHSWATIAYSLGVSKDVISQALGHSIGCETTEIYLDKDPKLVDDANRKVIDALFADAEGDARLPTVVA